MTSKTNKLIIEDNFINYCPYSLFELSSERNLNLRTKKPTL